MPQILQLPGTAAGVTIQTSNGASASFGGVAGKARWHNLAGRESFGVVRNGVSMCGNIQYGTGPTESPSSTAVTSSPSNQESGAAHQVVTVDPLTGDQSMAFGRLRYSRSAGTLRMMQRREDALVSNNPRFQVYQSVPPNRVGFLRFYAGLQLGDAETPWPAYNPGFNDILIWQLNGVTAAFPSLTLSIFQALSGRQDRRDFVVVRRTDNTSSTTITHRVPDVEMGKRYDFCLDVRLDWLDRSAGGAPFLKLWQGQTPLMNTFGTLEDRDTHTIYPPSANYVYPTVDGAFVPMWGIYRYRHVGVQAPDDCAIIWHKARTEHSLGPLPLPQWGA